MEDEPALSRRPCLERVPDGHSWRAIPNRPLLAMQLAIAAFLALVGILLLFLGIKLAFQPEQSARELLFVFIAGMFLVIVGALKSMVARLLPWREAVFVIEGSDQHLRLLRGGRRKMIPLPNVTQIVVVHEGPSDRGPADSYLEIRTPRCRLVGRRCHEPTVADQLRRLLPSNIEVREQFR